MKYNTLNAPNLSRAQSGAYDFQLGEYINKGFKVVTDNLGLYLGFAALWMVIYVVSQFIPVIGGLAYSFVVAPTFLAGLYIVADKYDRGEHTEFADFFKGFDKLGELALMTLIQVVIVVALMIPAIIVAVIAGVSMDGNFEGGSIGLFLLAGLLFIVPAVYAFVSWSFATFFIVFYDMQPWDAMETSRKTIGARFGMFLLLTFVAGLIGVAGALALGIGLLFTLPAAALISYAAFKHIVGMPHQDIYQDTMSHLVD